MASQVYQIAGNVRETKREMSHHAANGWHFFVIRPDGRIHSKHRNEAGTRNNINEHMKGQGFKVWSFGLS